MARYMIEFDSPEELASFVHGKTSTGPEGRPLHIVNGTPQTIKLKGSVAQVAGEEVMVVEVCGRGEPDGPAVTSVAPGESTTVAR